MKKTVAVDFDGVLNTYTGWQGESELFEPREGAREFLEALAERYVVVVYSTRNADHIWDWLDGHGMADLIASVSNGKPKAIAYIDDRAVRFRGDFDEALAALDEPAHWER